jgi:transcriptional regulator of arginine metabolism
MTADKQARLFAVKAVITGHVITTQEQLRRELRKRGIRVTQATLSRDLAELGVVWNAGGTGRYTLEAPSEATILRPIVGAEILSIMANEALIVVHTLPGCASTVGEFLDVQKNEDIIGTVAGDNTVLVIPRSLQRTQNVLRYLHHLLIEANV